MVHPTCSQFYDSCWLEHTDLLTASALVDLCGRHQLVVQISPSVAERKYTTEAIVLLEVKPRSAEQTGPLKQSLLVHNPTGRDRPRSRPPSGQWTFHEAACDQGGRHLLLSSTPPPPDPQTSRQWSNDTARPRVDYVSHWLLQLSTGRPAAVDDRTTAASAERSSSTGVWTRTERARYSKPSPALLATSLLAGPVQDMLLNALDLSWQLSGVSEEHRPICCC